METKTARSLTFANTFGVFGYIGLLFQWMWVAAIFLPVLFENQMFKQLFLPENSSDSQPIVDASSTPSGLTIAIGLIVTVVIIAITLIVLVRLPATIARSGTKLTHETARIVRPIVTHHQKLPQKKQRLLDARLVLYIKLVVGAAPLLLLMLLPLISPALEGDVIVLVSAFLGGVSLLWFCLQYGLARVFRLPADKLI